MVVLQRPNTSQGATAQGYSYKSSCSLRQEGLEGDGRLAGDGKHTQNQAQKSSEEIELSGLSWAASRESVFMKEFTAKAFVTNDGRQEFGFANVRPKFVA